MDGAISGGSPALAQKEAVDNTCGHQYTRTPSRRSGYVGSRSLPINSQPDVVIFEGNYPAWPWVTRDSRGRLLCTFREDGLANREDSGHGFSPLGMAMFTFSVDEGKTWSTPGAMVDNPGYDDCCPAIAELPDGTLLASYYSRLSAGGYSQAWVTRSTDGGQSWGPSTKLAEEDTRVRGAPVALSNGDILVPIYRSMFSRLGHVSMTAISADGGVTWHDGYVPNTRGGELNEWVAREVEPGRLIGLHRDEHEETRGFFWKTESRDWGRTWSHPVRTNVRSTLSASPPHLDLHGKSAVMTYSGERMVSVSMATTSDPDYLVWDLKGSIQCYRYRADGARIADASYPCSVAIGPHRRLIVDYEIESRITPSSDIAVEYALKRERKQLTGHFVNTPSEWGAAW